MFCLFVELLQKEEEIHDLQKQISSLEGELDQAQTQLAEATTKLEATEKQLSVVSHMAVFCSRPIYALRRSQGTSG